MSVEATVLRDLPEHLPAGERLLWQGRPRWTVLGRRALHTRKIALYFGVLLVWGVLSDVSDGQPLTMTALSALGLTLLALAAVGLPALLAWLMARTTVYVITSRRIIMRFGVALPMTVNIPFAIVGSAGLRTYADGTGDIPLALTGPDRMAYLHLWPHVRPWRVSCAEPMLRAVPDAAHVAEILAEALAAATHVRAQAPTAGPEPAAVPARQLSTAA